tara:strand:+ start:8317 stop:9750 length:1434 start_codon:yes stop_codon:yes gene_type:complete
MIFFKILKAKLLNSLIKSILPIFIVPFYLNIWGSESYADWIFYYNLCAIFTLLDLGFNQFSATHLHLSSSKNSTTFQRLIGACNASYFIYFFLYICLVLFFYFFGINFINDFNFSLFFFLGSWYFFSLLNAYLIQMYRVFNEDHIGTYFAIFYNIFLYGGTIIFLYYFSFDLIKIASLQLAIVNFSTITTFYFLKKKYNKIYYLFFDLKEIKSNLIKSSYYLLYKFSTYLSVNMPIILISIFNQAYILSFTLNRTLANIQGQFINLAHNSLIQNITNNSKNTNLTKSFFIFSMNIMFATSIMMGIITYLFYELLLSFWLEYSQNFDINSIINYELIKLILIYTIIYNLWKSATIFVTSINKHEQLSRIYMVYSIVLAITIFIAVFYGDIYSMLKSMILLESILLFYILKMVIQRVLGVSLLHLLKNMLLNLIPLTISILIMYLFNAQLAFILIILVYGLYVYANIKVNEGIYRKFLR